MTMTTGETLLQPVSNAAEELFAESRADAEADAVADVIRDRMAGLRGDDELARRFQASVPQTPLTEVSRLVLPPRSDGTPSRHRVFWKGDGEMLSGAYKFRGMLSALLRAEMEAEETGELFHTIAVGSTGNHAGAAALAGMLRGKRVSVYMPQDASPVKQQKVRGFGGDILFEDDLDDSLAAARAHGEQPGVLFLHPFDTPDVIAGQGSVLFDAYEDLLEHGVDADEVMVERYVPAGGGGNLTGQAVAGEWLLAGSPLWFVQSVGAAALVRALDTTPGSEPFSTAEFNTHVDGAAVLNPGEYAKTIIKSKRYVAGGVEVTDGEVGRAIETVRRATGRIYEPAGALAMAGILAAMEADPDGERVFMGHGSGMNTTFDIVSQFAAAGVAEGLMTTAEEYALESDARLRLGRMPKPLEEHAMELAAAREATQQDVWQPVRSGTQVLGRGISW